jgi:hypothetical protein
MSRSNSTPLHWRSYRQLPGKSELFPSDASLRWFIRCHESELVRKRAMIRHHRKPMLLPDRFDRVVLEIGMRQAHAFARRQA